MLHSCFVGIRATLCIFPISHLQGSTGSICSLPPSHQPWPNPGCCPVSRESLGCAGLSQWFKPSYLRMWWISSACSPQPGADGYLRDMLQLKQRERCLMQELQGQPARPVLCGRSGKVSWHFKPVHLHCKSQGCLQEDDRHEEFNGKHLLFLFCLSCNPRLCLSTTSFWKEINFPAHWFCWKLFKAIFQLPLSWA